MTHQLTSGKAKEIHVWLNYAPSYAHTTFCDTDSAIYRQEVVHTTQTHHLSWSYGERLFVHVDFIEHEITLGRCEGTNREIKKFHNIEKMLIAGEFDWF